MYIRLKDYCALLWKNIFYYCRAIRFLNSNAIPSLHRSIVLATHSSSKIIFGTHVIALGFSDFNRDLLHSIEFPLRRSCLSTTDKTYG